MYWNEDDKNDRFFPRFAMSKQVGHNDYKDSSGNNFRSDNRSDKKSNDSCSKDKLDIHVSNLKTHLGNKNAAVGRNDYKDAKKDSISVERTRSLYIQKVIKNK